MPPTASLMLPIRVGHSHRCSWTRTEVLITRVLLCSAEGVSMGAQYAELIAYSITLAYNIRQSAAA